MRDPMNAREYCETVEQKDRLQQKLIPTIPIKESNSPLVSLKEAGFNLIFEPCIQKDYKYSVRAEIVEKVGRISRLLDKEDKVLIIRSAWRSFEHQQLLLEYYFERIQKEQPDKSTTELREIVSGFMAPRKKSMHATGGAVDALIFDFKSDCIMDFGTNDGYKIEHNKECYPFHPGITPRAKANRKLLIDLFVNEDFVCDVKEYWHFDYGNVIWAIEKGKEHSFYGVVC
jgi:D-alanyl-D-alanine dipeptidase